MIIDQVKTLIKKHFKQGQRSNLFRKELYPVIILLFIGMYTGIIKYILL